jgi:alpha-galactosidase
MAPSAPPHFVGARLAAAAALATAALGYDNGSRSRLPPMGWSSWIALGPGASPPIFDYCDEPSVLASIDALVALGLPDHGYTAAHLDDCWAGPRNSSGFLTAEADHFPNGMTPIVEAAHKYNLSFGLYTCAGTQTCVGNRPGSKDHWTQDAQVWAEWQVDWMKVSEHQPARAVEVLVGLQWR